MVSGATINASMRLCTAVGRHHEVSSKFLIECKRYAPDNPVGVELVRSLYGVKVHEKATKAILATTSRFTASAQEFGDQHLWELELKDYKGIIAWIRMYNTIRGKTP